MKTTITFVSIFDDIMKHDENEARKQLSFFFRVEKNDLFVYIFKVRNVRFTYARIRRSLEVLKSAV